MADLDVRTVGDACILEVTKSDLTDAAYIKTLGDEMYQAIRLEFEPKVVVDFSRVERLSSAALGMLVALKKVVVEKKGGRIRIAGVADNLHDIFKITRVDRELKMHETVDAAVHSFG